MTEARSIVGSTTCSSSFVLDRLHEDAVVSYSGVCGPAAAPPASRKGGESATKLTPSRSNTTNG
jgi:hypothetical protein